MRNHKPSARVVRLLKKRSGILLDVSLGGTPQENALTFRVGGDVHANPLTLPFPLPDRCVHTAVVTHVLEYLAPNQFFKWWNELHRVMLPSGVVHISGPYGGDESAGWLSDPQHLTRVIEQSFAWLDPRTPLYGLHDNVGRAKPLPWHPLGIARVPGQNGTIGYTATLRAAAPPKPLRARA